jgi:hypothetical protein
MKTTRRRQWRIDWAGRGKPCNAGNDNIKSEPKMLCWNGSLKDNIQVGCRIN